MLYSLWIFRRAAKCGFQNFRFSVMFTYVSSISASCEALVRELKPKKKEHIIARIHDDFLYKVVAFLFIFHYCLIFWNRPMQMWQHK